MVIPYIFVGGYLTLAWIDLFQGIFLMLVIVATPLFLLYKLGGWTTLFQVITAKNLSLSLFTASPYAKDPKNQLIRYID
jgi:sodium/proline symporter